jgi:hypothetical protein
MAFFIAGDALRYHTMAASAPCGKDESRSQTRP